jgi:predicted component of type VI protein secretion system
VRLEIDVLTARERRRMPFDADRVTIGKSAENDIALTGDAAASHLHAVLEQFPAAWCITDLGSSNGTWINGRRIAGQSRVRAGDEIRVGHTRLLVGDAGGPAEVATDVEAAPPMLTPRERDVLLALCRPLLTQDMFTQPASTRAIADELVVTPAAVKQHLVNLYEKFGLGGDDAARRVTLANEALTRGAVTLRDLHDSATSGS